MDERKDERRFDMRGTEKSERRGVALRIIKKILLNTVRFRISMVWSSLSTAPSPPSSSSHKQRRNRKQNVKKHGVERMEAVWMKQWD